MRTIILIGLIIGVALLIGLAMDVRLSAGPYSPESEAEAAVIREMAPQATSQALQVEQAAAIIHLAAEKQKAEQSVVNHRRWSTIGAIAGGLLAAILLGLLAGLLAAWIVRVRKSVQVPAGLAISPNLAIIRLPDGELRVLDLLTGANFALLADRSGDPLRADHQTRIELARMAQNIQPAELEILQPIPIQQPSMIKEFGNNGRKH